MEPKSLDSGSLDEIKQIPTKMTDPAVIPPDIMEKCGLDSAITQQKYDGLNVVAQNDFPGAYGGPGAAAQLRRGHLCATNLLECELMEVELDEQEFLQMCRCMAN